MPKPSQPAPHEQATAAHRQDHALSQQLMAMAFSHSQNIAFVKDEHGNFEVVNEKLAALYGSTPEAMAGKHDADFNPNAEQVEFYRQNVARILKTGVAETVIETSTDVESGEIRHFRSVKTPFTGPDGRKRLLVVATDISDLVDAREQAEAATQAALAARREAEAAHQRLDYALATIDEGVWDWDIRQGMVRHNRKWCELLGLGSSYLEHPMQVYSDAIHPDDRARVFAALERCLASAEPYRAEYRMRRPDGNALWVCDRGDVVERDASGRPLRMVGALLDISRRREDEAEITRLAYTDPLTGLANRRRFQETLARVLAHCAREGEQGALIYLDLDHFKETNDTLGHAAGDRLLQDVAHRLCDAARDSDLIARLGGDEFVVLLGGLPASTALARTQAGRCARRLLARLSDPASGGNDPIRAQASAGVTVFSGLAESVETVLMQADLALYQAKADGRGRHALFEPKLHEKMARRTQLVTDLDQALAAREFFLALQPQHTPAGTLTGAEVLLRWRDANSILHPPSTFIPAAEASGQILPIGRFVLAEACALLARWQGIPALSGVTLAVNVSAAQFAQPDFDEQVKSILAAHGAPPGRLKLELTETVLLGSFDETLAKMQALCRHGVRFSLDDFGTGYSSLAYLKKLPLHELKIAQEFMRALPGNADDCAIVDTVIALGKAMELTLVAEGVETDAQRDYLCARGCDTLQGYLLGRPQPVDAFEQRYA